MGYEELIAALVTEGERTIKQMRDAAAEQRGQIEQETEMIVSRMKSEYECAAVARARLAARNAQAAAEGEARALKAVAENELAEKLYLFAQQSLFRLREELDETGFTAVAGKVPLHSWGAIHVNPADRKQAEKLFPGASVIADAGIAGGVEVCSSDGSVCVVSTYEKMLEMAWPFILPGIMAHIRRGLR